MKNGIKEFKDYCAAEGLRVTPQRLLALRILQAADKPLTAYDVLELMKDGDTVPKPPTAYRALDFLEAHGFAHRIESLNAYVVCDVDHLHQGSQFMICTDCGGVEEVHLCSLPETLTRKTQDEGFKLHHWNVELHGQCNECQSQSKL